MLRSICMSDHSQAQRLVALGADAADILHAVGAWSQVVGVTAFYEPDPEVEPKPRVSGFSSANLGAILQLAPDLVITSSDVQHAVASELIRAGVRVCALQAHSLADVFSNIRLIGRVVDRADAAEDVRTQLEMALQPVEPAPSPRPRVYFEEWYDPMISGIGWVSELIERAGGLDIFAEHRSRTKAAERCVTTAEIVARAPGLIVASWCGQRADLRAIAARPGWAEIPAVREGRVIEIDSSDILQAGPRVTRGYDALKRAIAAVATVERHK